MTSDQKQYPHFQGKKAIDHVIEARKKGRSIVEEMHGIELSGFPFALMDSTRETSLFFLIIGLSFWFFSLPFPWIGWIGFLFAFVVWRTTRCSFLAWSRLNRFHQLIEEERWEIEHHREQERAELVALYRAKGFKEPLLNEVIDVLMADDNRLLQVMLEEELGLPLGIYDHPLKQGFGALLGSFFSGLLILVGFYFFAFLGFALTGSLLFFISTFFLANWGKNQISSAMFWQIAAAALTLFGLYFFLKTLISL